MPKNINTDICLSGSDLFNVKYLMENNHEEFNLFRVHAIRSGEYHLRSIDAIQYTPSGELYFLADQCCRSFGYQYIGLPATESQSGETIIPSDEKICIPYNKSERINRKPSRVINACPTYDHTGTISPNIWIISEKTYINLILNSPIVTKLQKYMEVPSIIRKADRYTPLHMDKRLDNIEEYLGHLNILHSKQLKETENTKHLLSIDRRFQKHVLDKILEKLHMSTQQELKIDLDNSTD